MATNFKFRKDRVGQLTREVGVYVLADLENTPVYVGQSKDGIRQRVQRHLTSARSDIIANRQIDVWEIAFVWAYPCPDKDRLDELEAQLFHTFHGKSPLMNGKVPPLPDGDIPAHKPTQIVQVLPDDELEDKLQTDQRLSRQASHYASIVGHFLTVKNSSEIALAMDAHFQRLRQYHESMIASSED